MKSIVFYSNDFNMCFSLLIYLQNNYKVTTTTDLDIVKSIVKTSDLDLLIMDTDPSEIIECYLKDIRNTKTNLPIVLTYVFKNQIKELDTKLREYVNSIFYKPFDLNEISMKLSLMV